MLSLVTLTAWSLDPSKFNVLREASVSKQQSKKKKGAQEPAIEVKAMIKLSESLKSMETLSNNDLQEWAASTFDANMYTALPLTVNKKSFVKLTWEKTLMFFKTLANVFNLMNTIADRVKLRDIEVDEIVF